MADQTPISTEQAWAELETAVTAAKAQAQAEITSGPLAGWTVTRHGPTDTPRDRVAKLLFDNGFTDTAMNLDFAYDDDEARLFLGQDLDRIHRDWTGSADDLAEIDRFTNSGPAR
jgi:hypothetical protein